MLAEFSEPVNRAMPESQLVCVIAEALLDHVPNHPVKVDN